VTILSSQQFIKELTSKVKVLELCVVFRSCETDNNNIKIISLNNSLANMPEQLCLKYRNFFNINKAEQQPSYQPTDHAIELKSDSKPPYMQIYNISSAELKALDKYLTKTLTKE
jgi:hypothetical protein